MQKLSQIMTDADACGGDVRRVAGGRLVCATVRNEHPADEWTVVTRARHGIFGDTTVQIVPRDLRPNDVHALTKVHPHAAWVLVQPKIAELKAAMQRTDDGVVIAVVPDGHAYIDFYNFVRQDPKVHIFQRTTEMQAWLATQDDTVTRVVCALGARTNDALKAITYHVPVADDAILVARTTGGTFTWSPTDTQVLAWHTMHGTATLQTRGDGDEPPVFEMRPLAHDASPMRIVYVAQGHENRIEWLRDILADDEAAHLLEDDAWRKVVLQYVAGDTIIAPHVPNAPITYRSLTQR